MTILDPLGAAPLLDLLDDLVCAISHALWLEDDRGGTFRKEGTKGLQVAGEPRQKSFRTLFDHSLGELRQHVMVDCVLAHHQFLCSLPGGLVGHELAALRLPRNPSMSSSDRCDASANCLSDVISSPQNSARTGRSAAGREDVEDSSSDGELSASLHDVVALVAHLDQPLHHGLE